MTSHQARWFVWAQLTCVLLAATGCSRTTLRLVRDAAAGDGSSADVTVAGDAAAERPDAVRATPDAGTDASLDGGRDVTIPDERGDLGATVGDAADTSRATDGSAERVVDGAPQVADGSADADADAARSADGADGAAEGARAAEAGAPALELAAGALGGLGNGDGFGTAARFNSPKGAASDGQGHLYVADHDNQTIRKIVLATGQVTTLAGAPGVRGNSDGQGAAARFMLPWALTYDGAGNLFVVDWGNLLIRKIVLATAQVSTVAGPPPPPVGIDDPMQFSDPRGIAADGLGNLFVADFGSHTIRKVVIATGEVTTFAGALDESGSTDGVGQGARFNLPSAMVSDGAGALFVADGWALRKLSLASAEVTTLTTLDRTITSLVSEGNGRLLLTTGDTHAIYRFDPATLTVTTLIPSTRNPAGDGADVDTPALFVAAMALDGGDLYLAEDYDHRIRKVALATGEITNLAGAMPRSGITDGVGSDARLTAPHGLASDGAGNLFVADSGTGLIRKIVTASGTVSTFAGSPNSRLTIDGVGAAAAFSRPEGLASDGVGHLFVTDGTDRVVRQVGLADARVTTLAGSPRSYDSNDGRGVDAGFVQPLGATAKGGSELFVVDGQAIRRITLATGEVTTFAGDVKELGTRDGIGRDARFTAPCDVQSDGVGNLFVTDRGNSTIRRIVVSTGQVTTLAGTAREGGNTDGIGAAARFANPQGLAYDGNGNLYVADTANQVVRKIVVATGAVTTVVGTPGRAAVVLGELPGGLSSPTGLAFGSAGELYISNADENVVLVARFAPAGR